MRYRALSTDHDHIFFYGRDGELGFLSNMFSSPFYHDGERYATVEHYFQAAKAAQANNQVCVLC
jgi:predicted NAD-dependent protein-ADP-ribosyltransferase YbiA (DUF1768 family)